MPTFNTYKPNNCAGKSTLFNRLLDKSSNRAYRLSVDKRRRRRITGRLSSAGQGADGAIVSPEAGTTRDRRECIGRIGGTYFRLLDTAGVDADRLQDRGALTAAMMRQTLEGARYAELVCLLFDARVGMTSDLQSTVKWLRQVPDEGMVIPRRVVLLANKLEGDSWNYDGSPVLDHLAEATRVGFGAPIPISAAHGEGMAELAVEIEEMTAAKREALAERGLDHPEESEVSEEKPLQLAILGRQNVGKSTLVNALLQTERVITGPTPGLTRDAIAVEWTYDGRPVQLVDTAGIRKRAQRDHSTTIEDMAVEDAMRALKTADVAVLVIDADARMLHRQELAIADTVLKEGRALVLVANKMDLILEDDYDQEQFAEDVRTQLEARFPYLRKTPIIPMSSLTGEAVADLMPVVFQARERWQRVITTGQLNAWLSEVVLEHPPPRVGGKPTRIKYIMQTKGRPPTFLLFCNTGELPDSYIRYLTRHFQDTFEMYGMEVRLAVKKSSKSNPYAPKAKRGGSGLGGRDARQQRLMKDLRTPGATARKHRRRRRD